MPEHLRALVVITVLAFAVFAFAKKLLANQVEIVTFNRWRNFWFALTFAAFLSHSFWLYAGLAVLIVLVTAGRVENRIPLFFVSLFAVPAAGLEIPGFGTINYLISLNHVRILELSLLLPAYLLLRSQNQSSTFGRLPADKLLLAYMVLEVSLQLRGTSVTDSVRQSFYVFINVFLPYYVISRSLKSIEMIRQSLAAFVLASLLLAALAFFETIRHWNLYAAVIPALDPSMEFGTYLGRAGSLRASVSTGHSIALGYTLAVAIGFYLFLQQTISNKLLRRLGMVVLLSGLLATLSRGPWVGFAIVVLAFVASGRSATKRLTMIAFAGILTLLLLTILPGGQNALNLLPFLGTVDQGNIDYRARLIDNALIVIQRNLWLGSVDYYNTPELEALRQGQGIIDIVNTYIGLTLARGLVGLGLFVGFFLSVLWGIRKSMRSFGDPDKEIARLGRALFATLVGVMLMIFTVSSITIIPIVYWSVAGLGVAYIQMVREHHKTMGANRAD